MKFKYYRIGTEDELIISELITNDIYQISRLQQYTSNYYNTVIDCGAHIGTFTWEVNETIDNLTYICFEPHPDNYKLLCKNTQHIHNIQIFNSAVSNHTGKAKLLCYKTGQNFLSPIGDIEVNVINLNKFLDTCNTGIFILKIDTEGHEGIILNSISDTNLNKIKILIIEEHDNPPETVNYNKLKNFILLFNPYKMPRHKVLIRN